jgi:hypothetical protein
MQAKKKTNFLYWSEFKFCLAVALPQPIFLIWMGPRLLFPPHLSLAANSFPTYFSPLLCYNLIILYVLRQSPFYFTVTFITTVFTIIGWLLLEMVNINDPNQVSVWTIIYFSIVLLQCLLFTLCKLLTIK